MSQNGEPLRTRPLTYKGLTVPHIAAWSSETSTLTANPDLILREHLITRERHIAYADEQPQDRKFGVLWGRMPDTPGVGRALFASLHTTRQREVMARAGCQVCGGVGEIWMVPASVWDQQLAVRGPAAPYDTSDPPLCRACIPTATRQCPNLSTRGHLFLAARSWAITGIRGYVADARSLAFGLEEDIALNPATAHDAARLRLTLAKGLLATLHGITVHTDPDRVHGLGRRADQLPAPARTPLPAPRRGQ